MPESCCKVKQENCGTGIINETKSEAIQTINDEGCFKLFQKNLDSHTLEGILIVSIVCLSLMLLILYCFKMAYKMRQKQRKEKTEKIFLFKMHDTQFDLEQ